MCVCASSIKASFNDMIRMMKTQRGCHEWCCDQALGVTTDRVMKGVLSGMSDASALRRIGFIGSIEDGGAACAQDVYLATKFVDFARELISARLKSSLLNEWCLPSRFALLVHHDEGVRSQALSEARQWWDILEQAERASGEDIFLRKILKDMAWPHQVWPREVLATLWECEFDSVAPDLECDLRAYTTRLCTTKAVEDAFNLCRDRERDSKSGSLGAKGVWSALRCSGIAQECERPTLATSGAARSAAAVGGASRPVLAAVFQPDPRTCSLREEESSLTDRQRDWPSHGPTTYYMQGMATWALMSSEGDSETMQRMWQSLLMVEGSIVKHKDSGALYWVVHSSPFGCILWHTSHTASPSQGLMVDLLPEDCERPWELRAVYCHDSWAAVELDIQPPMFDPTSGFFAPGRAHIAARIGGKAQPLLHFSARRGFPGISSYYLSRLWSLLKVSSKRPPTEQGLLKGLLLHLWPDMPEATLAEILNMRKQPAMKERHRVLYDEGAEDMTRSMLEDDITEAIFKEKDVMRKRSAAAAAAPKHTSSGGAASSSSGHAGAARKARKKVSITGAHTPDDVKKMIPQVLGCTIKRDQVGHNRWQAQYPCQEPPHSWSKAWNAMTSEAAALRYVLVRVWEAHARETGEACPYDFAE